MERLQKVIANSGYCSRRKAEELISQGKVYVDGVKVTELGTKVNEEQIIVVEGVTLNKNTKKVYYLLYKPSGYICSLKDEHGRKVVTDFINTNERIYIDDALNNKDIEYICPICKEKLIIKNGSVIIPHFAHKSPQRRRRLVRFVRLSRPHRLRRLCRKCSR